MSSKIKETDAVQPPKAWWREYMMWLVVGGPGAVVLASFVTLGLAIKHPDPVIESPSVAAADAVGRGGGEAQAGSSNALTPAMRARNHAATGGH